MDLEEERFIQEQRIAIAKTASDLTRLLSQVDPVYVHVDYDVLDGKCHCHSTIPESGGLALSELIQFIRFLRTQYLIVGMSLTEYAPIGAGDVPTVRTLLGEFGLL